MAITKTQFSTLEDLFNFYNTELFANQLPECLVNLNRHKGAHGLFAPSRWKDKDKETKIVHEIALNPDTMNRPDKEWHSTLVHEMVHLWQQVSGKPSRSGYHNKEWADKMDTVGLCPTNTGQKGGKRTGEKMTHFIVEGHAFDRAFSKINENDKEHLKLKYIPNARRMQPVEIGGEGEEPEEEKRGKSGVKIKYVCSCENKVWGKMGLKIRCMDCDQDFEPEIE